jgi:(p)ppGpp synthase/HD superfamily hydrolase
MEEVLERVRDFADRAHGEQTRKYTPDRYIVHPERVMEICRRFTSSVPILAAALLHDVLEDTSTTKHQIQDFLLTLMNEKDAKHTLRLVVELTDIYTKSNYPQLNRKKRKAKEAERLGQASTDAQLIKYADIIDNVKEIVDHDADFADVFLHECKLLLKSMNKGNQELYKEAINVVEASLKKLSENSQ